ncbi:low molecular weight protein-tyrosine-phosphatase [Pleomorphovibrio marinus]|uniref:low molecular weight protein-tyrosine-phosphatase n=1 Tax=Pleomorphovibrio marinus TaxID=2164132 RepID=UPI000E0BE12B|nr:low molecular weight protein-tyrosine-phosphatase [Pleomorphovibrio marinus]
MIKVLFICLGNICRSPLAAAIFTQKLHERNYTHQVSCDSCGTSDYHIGELPDERTIACAKRHSIQLHHRGRQLNRSDFKDFDLFIAMDQSNVDNINMAGEIFKMTPKCLFLIRHFQKNADSQDVPDPYYGGEEGFEKVYEILNESIDGLISMMEKDFDIENGRLL